MRIAYITTYDANDRRQWSGLGHAILQSLRLQGFDVVPLGPMRNGLAWLGRQKGRFYYRLPHGAICSMSRSGNVWDNAAMESFFSSLKTERTGRKTYRTRDEARADVFDYIERFYNAKRRHSRIGYLSPMEFERQAGLA
jgi:transposase InsO family protein